ncbi:TetR/AcrR family transcriptional regulator [Nocardioides ginsengisoli]|uniref:TetR/AcrR family transcriptional regulator n=1 Tax=Nocardioides ginsengisoli TaxID=363868 RepID=A0ABW3VWE6_9ACTN
MDRSDIHRVALRQFATKGYHGTTVRHLAAALEVTAPAIYHHFRSKDEVLTSLIEDIVTQDLVVLRLIQDEQPTAAALDAVLFAHVYGMCVGREETLVVDREAKLLTAEFAERVARVLSTYRAIIAEMIGAEYALAGPELELATRAVLGLGASVVPWFDANGALEARDVALAFITYARGILSAAEGQAGRQRGGPASPTVAGDCFAPVAELIDRLVDGRRSPSARREQTAPPNRALFERPSPEPRCAAAG